MIPEQQPHLAAVLILNGDGMAWQDVNVPACSSTFLTREYAKRNEWVIGEDSQFTHSLAHAIHHLDVNFIHISTYVMQISSSLAQDIFSNWKLLFSFFFVVTFNFQKKNNFSNLSFLPYKLL